MAATASLAAPRVAAPPAPDLLAAALQDLPDGIALIESADDRVVAVNRAVRQLLGYEPAWLVGRSLGLLRPPGSPSVAARAWRHGLVVEDCELRRIDGSRCPIQLRARPTTVDGRELVLVTLRDIRERRRAEEQHRSIFENAIEGIFQTTPDGQYLTANPALARIYGYASPAELMAHLTDIAEQLYVDAGRRREFRRLLEERDAVQSFESEVRRRDGAVVWISENARAVRDADGRLRHYEGTVVDITARKHAEAAEREEAAVAAALVRVGEALIASINSPAILERLCEVTLDALACDWSHTLLWLAARDAYVPVAAADREAGAAPAATPVSPAALAPLLERLARDEVVVLDAAACAALPAALRPGGRPCGAAIFFPIRRGDACDGVLMAGGRERRRPFTAADVRVARGIAHLAAIALAHARALEELARANRVKSEFVATMSHELRTPLNIILGYTELLRGGSFGDVTAEQREVLARVARSGDELLELITATLDLSRLESGRATLDLAPVDLPALLAAVAGEARELLRDKPAVALRCALAPDLPRLRTDAAKLKVVVKNLVSNAVKFTERGAVSLGAARRDDGIEVVVADTGIGIAPEALPIIFEAFRQADSSMTRRYGGVGLGLHVVRRLLSMLGGAVSVESAPGAGSTFRVWLPTAGPPA
ncbi:PAS domain-containing sensor histidine kinase [bacterium]|nr:PAS domain-containing sensor histidine kinase [bacterium]